MTDRKIGWLGACVLVAAAGCVREPEIEHELQGLPPPSADDERDGDNGDGGSGGGDGRGDGADDDDRFVDGDGHDEENDDDEDGDGDGDGDGGPIRVRSEASAVNNLSHVVGTVTYYFQDAEDIGSRAFLWRGEGEMIDLGDPPLGQKSFQQGVDLNENGQVIGNGRPPGEVRAWLWQNGDMTDLGTLGGDTFSVAINEKGQVTGFSATGPHEDRHAFVWENGVMTDLGTLGGDESIPTAISDTGLVVGFSDTSGANQHAFLWDGTTMIDLGTLGGDVSRAADVNDAGVVVGWSSRKDGTIHAFRWRAGTMTDLGTLFGENSRAVAINHGGLILGQSTSRTPGEADYITTWDASGIHSMSVLGTAVDVNNNGQMLVRGESTTFLLVPGFGRGLPYLSGSDTEGVDLNHRGTITGRALLLNGEWRAFLWSPGDGDLRNLGVL